jgi:ABC-2 type transport system ATP-binding protein
LRKVYPPTGKLRRLSGTDRDGRQPPVTAEGRAFRPSSPIVALESLDLDVREGEFFGLLGPNGAGKTTTLGILTTRVAATSGTATVAGADVATQPSLVRQRIGVVPQRPNPDRALNVRENLIFHAAYFGLPRSDAERRATELLLRLDIAEKSEAKVDDLSGGQQQRLMIARALIHEPQVIFLDEPTVGLDPQARLGLWDILRELHLQGRTLVMTTHYMEEADQLCDRLAIIDHGKLLAVDTPDGLKGQAPGGTLVELELDGDARAVAAATEAHPDVSRAGVHGHVVRVYSDRGSELIPELIKYAEEAGRVVKDIHLSRPSLETLFIALTGRKLD